MENNQPPLFYCENIVKNYEGDPVVDSIFLELWEGGFISLVGPSGTGKTTLFNVLAGVEKPDGGKVYLENKDVTGISGRVSYMPQKDLLLEYRSALDNVILPLLIRGEKKKTAREKAAAFFTQFGLAGCEKKYPGQLSGGMRQRAALLRTCVNFFYNNARESPYRLSETGPLPPPQKRIILLDEPFSALDAITRRQMQEWYCGIAKSMNLSTLFITHDVEEALILSDTVYIMNGKPGKIVKKMDVFPGRPHERDFPVSSEFVRQKRTILDTIGL